MLIPCLLGVWEADDFTWRRSALGWVADLFWFAHDCLGFKTASHEAWKSCSWQTGSFDPSSLKWHVLFFSMAYLEYLAKSEQNFVKVVLSEESLY